jgi:hypothetical protein
MQSELAISWTRTRTTQIMPMVGPSNFDGGYLILGRMRCGILQIIFRSAALPRRQASP